MLKINFQNAEVHDDGFGLTVNGKELSEIISTALGTRIGEHYGYNSNLPSFNHNSCNVTVIIDPQSTTECIETDREIWHSVKELKESKREQFKQKAEEAEG